MTAPAGAVETEETWPPAPSLPPPRPLPPTGSAASSRPLIALMWAAMAAGFAFSTFRGAVLLPLPLRGAMTLLCEIASLGLALFLVTRRDASSRLHGGARLGVSLLLAAFGFLHALLRF